MGDFIKNLLVLILVAFPPFLYIYGYLRDSVKSRIVRILLYILYWGSTVLASNIMPSLAVLFVIYKGKRFTMSFDESGEMVRAKQHFNFDGRSTKWDFSPREFLKVSFYGILIKFAVSYANNIVVEILSRFTQIPLEEQEIINEFLKANIWQGIIYGIMIAVCAPIVEEFVFRYWIYDRLLKSRVNVKLSAILSSLLFMAAHFNIQGAVAFFLVGIINCYLYDKKGYWASVANHFMFNFVTIIALIAVKVFNIPLQ